MNEHAGNTLRPQEDPLVTPLQSLNFSVDSHVTLAYTGSGVNQVLLQEVYRIGIGQPLVFTPLFEWSSREVLPPKSKRDDYMGISINAATVVSSSGFCCSNCTNKLITKPYITFYKLLNIRHIR
jgi:hypothetical protein